MGRKENVVFFVSTLLHREGYSHSSVVHFLFFLMMEMRKKV